MSGQERKAHVLERLAYHRGKHAHVGRSLCSTAIDVVEVPGAAIMLVTSLGAIHSVGVCGGVMEVIEELQVVHGEGPCLEAHRSGIPVIEPDLARPASLRWIGFSAPALEAGAKAVFGFPLRAGSTCIGALNLYADRPGALSEVQHRDALVLAEVATTALLSTHADTEPGELSWELIDEGGHLLTVQQATGMVAVQLDTDVDDAFVRLRAHAFVSGRRLSDVAHAIIDRRLRLEP